MSYLDKEKYSMLKSVLLKGSFYELYEFLSNLKINPIEVYDSGNNTLAQICASNNLLEKLEFLFKFIEKFYNSPEIPLWLNKKNKDSMTALHLSVISGNFDFVKFLIEQGADVQVLSACGLNLMHLAAKSNNMMMLAYFKDKGLSIVGLDDKGATPLHWAAYLGCELSVFTLLSWSVSVNLQDYDGLSPLHLASTNGNTQIIRILLLKGANPECSDYRGRTPMDFAKDYGFNKVVNLLRPPSLLNTLGIRNPTRPLTSKWVLCYIFFSMLSIGTLLNLYITFSYPYVFYPLALVEWVLLVAIICKDPGHLKSEDKSLMDLCLNNESVMICPECVLRRKPRSIHCQICRKCVEKFDHHCPWINNCIGGKNLALFYLFIWWTEVFIGCCLFYEIEFVMNYLEGQQGDEKFLLGFVVLLAVIEVGFSLPVGFLIAIQSGNLVKGKTTNERFNEENEECEYDEVDRRSICKNVYGMCCNKESVIHRPRRSEDRTQWDFNKIVLEYEKKDNKN